MQIYSFYDKISFMSAQIKIKNLQLKYIPSSDISLEINKGEIVGITGKNGSGKSLLMVYISGLIRPEKMGEIIIDGLDPFHSVDIPKIHKKVSVALQNPQDGIVFGKIDRDLVFGPANLGNPKNVIIKRVEGLLKKFNVFEYRKNEYFELSGGEMQRTYLAAIYAMKPEILVLDEPFSMQERKERKELISWTVKMAKKYGQTLIVVSHDKDSFECFDKIYELKKGRIIEGITESIDGDEASLTEELFSIGAEAFGEASAVHKLNDNIEIFEYKTDASSEEKLIEISDLSFSYGKKMIFDNINFSFMRGRLYKIVGSTGSGKTSLLSLLNATKRLDHGCGNVTVKASLLPHNGKDGWQGIVTENRYQYINSIRRTAGLVTQFPEDSLFEDTVFDDVMYGPLHMGVDKERAEKYARDALVMVGLDKFKWNLDPFKLSGGEKRAAAIAGILAMKPDILLLDEPFAGLDLERTEKIREMIRDYVNQGHTVIVTGH